MTTTVEQKELEALGDELLSSIAARWIELNQDLEVWEESDTGICTDRVRQIGEQLNRIGGYQMLMDARADVAERCHNFSPDMEIAFNTEINWVWNGIGNWQA